jgi:arylsulfatase A-like enzyme
MYEAEIRQLDELLGRFFGWLDDEDLGDETLFVITSDHGEEFQEHGSVLHGRTYYEEVIRIPLLLKGPGLPAGTVVEAATHHVDIVPTILGVMGIPSSQPRDGLDLSPTWSGGAIPERTLFSEADHNNRIDGADVHDILKMARRGSAKFVLDTRRGERELYDLAADPREQRDLSGAADARLAELEAELRRFLEGAVTPEAVPPPTDEEQEKLDALGYGGDEER